MSRVSDLSEVPILISLGCGKISRADSCILWYLMPMLFANDSLLRFALLTCSSINDHCWPFRPQLVYSCKLLWCVIASGLLLMGEVALTRP